MVNAIDLSNIQTDIILQGVNNAKTASSSNLSTILLIGFIFIIPVIIFLVLTNIKRIKKFFYLNFKRNYFIDANLIYENKQILTVPVLSEGKVFTYSKEDYTIKPKFLLFRKSIPEGYWFAHNPNQLAFNIDDKANKVGPDINSDALNSIIDNKILKELTSTDSKEKIIIYIVLILEVINLFMQIAPKLGLFK